MTNDPVQTPSLVRLEEQAKPEHVIQALRIGEQTLAENLFARVSKRTLADRLHDSEFSFRRVLSSEGIETRWLKVAQSSVIATLDNLGKGEILEKEVCLMVDGILCWFQITPASFLIDALETAIMPLDGGLYRFSWKQKYGIR